MSNKIISSINAIIDNQALPSNPNNVVAIDTQNSRIGVGTANPLYQIDVSGTIQTTNLKVTENLIFTSNSLDLSNLSLDLSSINISDLSINKILVNDLSVNTDLFVTNDIFVNNKLFVNNDVSLNNKLFVNNDVSLNNDLFVNRDISNNGNINSIKLFVNDICVNKIYSNNFNNKIDISSNIDLCGTLLIDGSATILGPAGAEYFQLTSDDRLKHNEVVINNGLNVINKLVPQLYQKTKKFKAHDFSGIVNEPYIIEAGLIAQELDNKIKYILDNSNNSNNNNLGQLEKIIIKQNIEIANLKKRIINLEKKI